MSREFIFIEEVTYINLQCQKDLANPYHLEEIY